MRIGRGRWCGRHGISNPRNQHRTSPRLTVSYRTLSSALNLMRAGIESRTRIQTSTWITTMMIMMKRKKMHSSTELMRSLGLGPSYRSYRCATSCTSKSFLRKIVMNMSRTNLESRKGDEARQEISHDSQRHRKKSFTSLANFGRTAFKFNSSQPAPSPF